MQDKLVLLDIDGTLVKGGYTKTNDRHTQAVKKIFGIDVGNLWDRASGKVIRRSYIDTLVKAGIREETVQEKIHDLLEEGHRLWMEMITTDYKKELIEESIPLLKKLHNKVYLGILSGNHDKTGWAKLEYVGLKKYFEFGVFGHDATDRIHMATTVSKKAKDHFGKDFKKENVYIIGDTPKDVLCGKAIEAQTIAVATGKYDRESLEKTEADLVVESLGDKKVSKFVLN